jgi:enoyl-CoA hydratase
LHTPIKDRAMNYDHVRFETDHRTGILTINRPEVLNALNRGTLEELGDVIGGVEKDSQILSLIITGSGHKAFVSGADIDELRNKRLIDVWEFLALGHEIFSKIERFGKPVIAAINGHALGGGLELALACDLRFASETAKLGQPEINLGAFPGWGGTQRLPRLVGHAFAKEIIFTGDLVDARRAMEIGLVNRVVPSDQVVECAKRMASKFNEKPPIALRFAKMAVNAGLGQDIQAGLTIEALSNALCFSTEDQQEGVSAFFEKRKPMFRGL